MKKDKTIALLLCVFLGYLGIHRFYQGKIKSGFLYLFTCGLCGIGWIYDIIQLVADKFTDACSKRLIDVSTSNDNNYTTHQPCNSVQQNIISSKTPTAPQNIVVNPTYNANLETDIGKINSPIATQENKNNYPIKSVNEVSQQSMIARPPKVTVSAPTKKEIKNFTLEEAIDVYLCTDHWSCKSIYDFEKYFSDAFECILKNIKSYDIQFSQEKVLRQKEIRNPINETKNITKTTNVNKIKDFVVIDTETTGLKCGGNDIIEICAIKFMDFRPVEKFHTYLKPRNPIPADATAINNITDAMVANAPTFAQIKTSLQAFIESFPLVAHNAPFDMKFLHVSGLDLSKHTDKVYDTLHLAKLKLRDFDGTRYESYKLGELCKEKNIACTNFHSADSDTLACGIIFVDIIKQVKEVHSINELL